ncbi:hypothetical protein [Arsenicibacter rosenii]|uniref:Uncharacterized protein n=1 Tax=Arsenicibacter rosenii TaxID=1750698 RepID=A0A1S2VLG4_9BACT|nr:hypothetical protein [Arsenicibacter rosenii]OIN58638.1 hypothetical protein BLX24_13810 [Arsenicibacter rosenii]
MTANEDQSFFDMLPDDPLKLKELLHEQAALNGILQARCDYLLNVIRDLHKERKVLRRFVLPEN